jgi:endogenous inhibitor of DNA gyrase (YacG/DUF329 family)
MVLTRVECPTCRVETPWHGNPHRPFCSERCRLIDLGAWIDEKHRVPGEPVDFEHEIDEAAGQEKRKR